METLENEEVTEQQKELCVIAIVRRMIEKYSEEKSIPYDEAFLDFAKSRTYKAVFDFDTGLWKEGPDYFISLYEEELSK